MAYSATNASQNKVYKGNSHNMQALEKFGLRFVPATSYDLLNEYYTVIVWRHPFTRLVSAYNNKVFPMNADTPSPLKIQVLQYLAQRKQPRATKVGRVTFDEFVDFVLSGHKNRHFNPIGDQCNMCNIRYDSVMRLESFEHDILSVLDVLQLNISTLNSLSHNRHRNNNPVTSNGNKSPLAYRVHPETLHEFRNISEAKIRALWNYYKDDFINFGYSFDVRTRAAICELNTGSKVCC